MDRRLHGDFKDRIFCRRNTINPKTGKPRTCSACDRYAQLKGDTSDRADDMRKLIYPRYDHLWNVLPVLKGDLKGGKKLVVKKLDEAYRILTCSKTLHNLLVDIFADEEYREKSMLGVTHSIHGRFIQLRRIGENLDTEYRVKVLSEPQPLAKDKATRIALGRTLNDLAAKAQGASEEDLAAFLRKMETKAGMADDDGDSPPDDDEGGDSEGEDTSGDDDDPTPDDDDDPAGNDDGDDGGDSEEDELYKEYRREAAGTGKRGKRK